MTGSSFAAVVTINVTPVNDVPVAIADNFTASEDTPLFASQSFGVLRNDSDIEPDVLTAVLGTTSANGTLTLNADGTFLYTPSLNFFGTDSFTYRARDLEGAESATATVTITVAPVNDPPVANNDFYVGLEDIELQIGPSVGVLANDADVDSASITAVLGTPPAHGTISLGTDGSFRYTPNLDFFGNDSFAYRASDGISSSNAATVSIVVEAPPEPPIAISDAFSTEEDAALAVSAPGVLANDADIDGDPLTAILVSPALCGTVSLALNGSFVYTPNANYFGPDSFIYRARDHHGFDSNLATVTITVHRSPEPPTAAPDSFNGTEDLQLAVGCRAFWQTTRTIS